MESLQSMPHKSLSCVRRINGDRNCAISDTCRSFQVHTTANPSLETGGGTLYGIVRCRSRKAMQAILAFSLLTPSFLLQQLPEPAFIMKQQSAAAQNCRTLQYIPDSSMEMLSGPFAGTKSTSEVSATSRTQASPRLKPELCAHVSWNR
jgi:hypothetical protein